VLPYFFVCVCVHDIAFNHCGSPLFILDFIIFFIACQWFFVLNGALAPCRMERSGMRLNPFIISAVRVFNTFNTFNRFSTKCCTIDFVILTNFQQFNNFSTKFSTVYFSFNFRFIVKIYYFSTFPQPLLLRLQQVNIISRVRACALSRVCARAIAYLLDRLNSLIHGAFRRQKPSTLLDRYWAR
jgi:hypothetical protein